MREEGKDCGGPDGGIPAGATASVVWPAAAWRWLGKSLMEEESPSLVLFE